eukprot:COSAG01_NODE_94_length_26962_cov_9.110933_34_plen_108_part_00
MMMPGRHRGAAHGGRRRSRRLGAPEGGRGRGGARATPQRGGRTSSASRGSSHPRGGSAAAHGHGIGEVATRGPTGERAREREGERGGGVMTIQAGGSTPGCPAHLAA